MAEAEELRILQMSDLAMMKEVARIADMYGLTYYLSAGSFLGAVRHKGFIPWDDDADIRMPRKDYEKFLRVLPKELAAPFTVGHFRYVQKEPVYVLRIYDPRIVLRRKNASKERLCNAWITVFPLDGMPEGRVKQSVRKLHLLWRRMWLHISVFDEIVTLGKKRKWFERAAIALVKKTHIERHISYRRNWRKMDRAMKRCPAETAPLYINAMSSYKYKDIMPKTYYGEGKMYPFEDTFFRGPADADAFLTTLYGDYMTPPPEKDRNKHLSEVVSIDPAYRAQFDTAGEK